MRTDCSGSHVTPPAFLAAGPSPQPPFGHSPEPPGQALQGGSGPPPESLPGELGAGVSCDPGAATEAILTSDRSGKYFLSGDEFPLTVQIRCIRLLSLLRVACGFIDRRGSPCGVWDTGRGPESDTKTARGTGCPHGARDRDSAVRDAGPSVPGSSGDPVSGVMCPGP